MNRISDEIMHIFPLSEKYTFGIFNSTNPVQEKTSGKRDVFLKLKNAVKKIKDQTYHTHISRQGNPLYFF